MTGLEVARLASGKCHVVFVTAYDKYAVAAFEQGAVDYVMKPFSAARLAKTVARLKARLRRTRRRTSTASCGRSPRTIAQRSEYLRWITASQGNELRPHHRRRDLLLPRRPQVHDGGHGDEEALIRRPIKELVEGSIRRSFWQIHRGTRGERQRDRGRHARLSAAI